MLEYEDETERVLRVTSETEERFLLTETEDGIEKDHMHEFIRRGITTDSSENLEIEPLPKGYELEKVYNSIDPMLRDVMCLLWGHNVLTRYSCQGHIENEDVWEEGYIYMDFNMLAFNALSRVMFQVDNTIRDKYKMEDNGNRTWYYPYMLIERSIRKVDDNYSKDELIVRFKFHPFNVVGREEFYSIFTKLLAIALEDEKEIELLKLKYKIN